jgi:hypothetical protein
MDFYPFETFNIFGQLIIGETAPRALTFVVGTTYHLLNGHRFRRLVLLVTRGTQLDVRRTVGDGARGGDACYLPRMAGS